MKTKIVRIILSAVLLGAAVGIEHACPALATWQLLLIFLVPYLVAGYDVLAEAGEGIAEGEVLDEDFLMCVATLGALAIGFLPGAETEFPEAVFVMLFFQVGELFEDYAEARSRRSIGALMEIRPDTARLVEGETTREVAAERVGIGQTILVKAGERVPLDGTVRRGTSSLNTVALTGESRPRAVTEGDPVLSGCINGSGVLVIEVTKTFGESTASKIIELVEHSAENKSRSETFIRRFARRYTPTVVGVALLLAFVPPFFCAEYGPNFAVWAGRALTFLVVSCPCALVISVPLTFFGGIGGASRRGILIKGGNYVDALAKVRTMVFDKTGTLTHGRFEVTAVHPSEVDAAHLLHLAAHVEQQSTHPIALTLREAAESVCTACHVEQTEERAGRGVRARVNGQEVCVGNGLLMDEVGAEWHACHHSGTTVHVAIDGRYAGHIVVSDSPKPDAAEALAALRERGIERTVMLTGDAEEVAAEVAQTVGVTEHHAGLLPADKVLHLERIMHEQQGRGLVAFVGDGINDAPVLARADVGIAMGGLGSDAAIEAADVVLMNDAPSALATAIDIARRTLRIARENVVFAIGVKLLVLVLAAFGLASMGMAVFADVGVTVLAVVNAMRSLKA